MSNIHFVTRRQTLLALSAAGLVLAGVPLGWTIYGAVRFPSERTPEGAYLRIAMAFGESQIRDSFSFLESAAQAALCTIHEYRQRSLAIIRASFHEPERSEWIERYRQEGDAATPADVWVLLARRHGWDARMKRDLSGIARVERAGNRATVETVRKTRYPFRRSEEGLWGLTLFTAELVAHKERAARDHTVVEKVASDYQRAPEAG